MIDWTIFDCFLAVVAVAFVLALPTYAALVGPYERRRLFGQYRLIFRKRRPAGRDISRSN